MRTHLFSFGVVQLWTQSGMFEFLEHEERMLSYGKGTEAMVQFK